MPKCNWLYSSCRLLMVIFLFLICFSSQCFSQNLDLNSLRDPFVSSQEIEHKNPENIFREQQPQINLLGVVKVGENFGAILERYGSQEVVFLNDKIWGCVVQKVTKEFVVVSREGKQIKLFFN